MNSTFGYQIKVILVCRACMSQNVCAHRGKTPITLFEKAPRIFIRGSNDVSWGVRCIDPLLYLIHILQDKAKVPKFGAFIPNLHGFYVRRSSNLYFSRFPMKLEGWFK